MWACTNVSGLILAGGQGRRMQQTGYPVKEKGLLMLAGQPLVAWVDKAFPATIRARYISANRCETGYQPYGQVIQDAPDLPSAAGPLVGLASSARVITTPWVFVLPVDMPFVPPTLLSTLQQAVTSTKAACVYAQTERPHPLCMLVHRELLLALPEYLHKGMRRVMEWQQQVGHPVSWDAQDHEFLNINTPALLQRASRAIKRG